MNDCIWGCIMVCNVDANLDRECHKKCKYYISTFSDTGENIFAKRKKEIDEFLKPLHAKEKERFEAYKKEQDSKHE